MQLNVKIAPSSGKIIEQWTDPAGGLKIDPIKVVSESRPLSTPT